LLATSLSTFVKLEIELFMMAASGFWLVAASSAKRLFLRFILLSSVYSFLFLKFWYLPQMNLSFLVFCSRNSLILVAICLICGSYFGTALVRLWSVFDAFLYMSLLLSAFGLFCFRRLNNSCTCCCLTFLGSLIS